MIEALQRKSLRLLGAFMVEPRPALIYSSLERDALRFQDLVTGQMNGIFRLCGDDLAFSEFIIGRIISINGI